MTDIDTTGADALRDMTEDLQKQGITFAMARLQPPALELLKRYKLLDKIGPSRIYMRKIPPPHPPPPLPLGERVGDEG